MKQLLNDSLFYIILYKMKTIRSMDTIQYVIQYKRYYTVFSALYSIQCSVLSLLASFCFRPVLMLVPRLDDTLIASPKY